MHSAGDGSLLAAEVFLLQGLTQGADGAGLLQPEAECHGCNICQGDCYGLGLSYHYMAADNDQDNWQMNCNNLIRFCLNL